MLAVILSLAVLPAALMPSVSCLDTVGADFDAKSYCESLVHDQPIDSSVLISDGAVEVDPVPDLDNVIEVDQDQDEGAKEPRLASAAKSSLFMCHPSSPNSFVRCQVDDRLSDSVKTDGPKGDPNSSRFGDDDSLSRLSRLSRRRQSDLPDLPDLRFVVTGGEELACEPPTFFNSIIKACVLERHSNCAARFGTSLSSENRHEQQLCDAHFAYISRSAAVRSRSPISYLICHDETPSDFVVCSHNSAFAHRLSCANGMFFNQRLGKCVQTLAKSDCDLRISRPGEFWGSIKRAFTRSPVFTTHTTHVANDSPWEIYANVRKDQRYTKSFNFGGSYGGKSLSVGAEYEWERVDKSGLTSIQRGHFKPFSLTGGTVYLTILAKLSNGNMRVLDNARPIPSDRSVIVQWSGHVAYAKYGSIWRPE